MMAMLRILGFRWKTPQGCKLGAWYYFTMAARFAVVDRSDELQQAGSDRALFF
jgi:hypothetical protein